MTVVGSPTGNRREGGQVNQCVGAASYEVRRPMKCGVL